MKKSIKAFFNIIFIFFKLKKAPTCVSCKYYLPNGEDYYTYLKCNYYMEHPKKIKNGYSAISGDMFTEFKESKKCTYMRESKQHCFIHGRFWEKKEEVKNG